MNLKWKRKKKYNNKLKAFERVADTGGWADAEHTLMLQCVFTGKA